MTAGALKAWRESLNLSQQDVASRLPTTLRTYQRWESGETEAPEFLDRALRDLERDLAREWGPKR